MLSTRCIFTSIAGIARLSPTPSSIPNQLCVGAQDRKVGNQKGTRPTARAMEFLDREFAQEARDEALTAATEARATCVRCRDCILPPPLQLIWGTSMGAER